MGPAGAPGVVLVHGTAAHARWWDHIAPFLQGGTSGEGASPDGAYHNSGLRVVAMSMSGHGDSDWRDHYGIDQWAAEVMAVAASARIAGPPVIVGHSLGGGVALYTAGRYGGALGGIVVIDTTVYEGPPPPRCRRRRWASGAGGPTPVARRSSPGSG